MHSRYKSSRCKECPSCMNDGIRQDEIIMKINRHKTRKTIRFPCAYEKAEQNKAIVRAFFLDRLRLYALFEMKDESANRRCNLPEVICIRLLVVIRLTGFHFLKAMQIKMLLMLYRRENGSHPCSIQCSSFSRSRIHWFRYENMVTSSEIIDMLSENN